MLGKGSMTITETFLLLLRHKKKDVMALAPVMVLAGPKGQKPARRAESGPKGRQLEVGPVGPIDF